MKNGSTYASLAHFVQINFQIIFSFSDEGNLCLRFLEKCSGTNNLTAFRLFKSIFVKNAYIFDILGFSLDKICKA